MTMALKTETSDHLQDMLLNGERRRRKKKESYAIVIIIYNQGIFQVDSFNKKANTHTQFFFKVS